MKNKVLVISGTPIISGAEIVLDDYLRNNEYADRIIIAHSDIEKVNDFYSKFNIRKNIPSKLLMPTYATSGLFGLAHKLYHLTMSFFVLARILLTYNVGVVLGNNTGDIFYSFYSFLFKKKHINYIHDMIEPNTFLAKGIKFFDRFTTQYIAVSFAVKKALISIGISHQKIVVVYNGVNPNIDYTKKNISHQIVFGFVGNIDAKKDPLAFLIFIEKASFGMDKPILGRIVYGEIQDDEIYQKMQVIIKDKKLNIEMIGRLKRDKMVEFYNSIDFLVLTSKKDSLPTVILEALSQAIPVIAHNIDGVPEMLIDKENGFLYNSIEDIDLIIKKLSLVDYNQLQENSILSIKDKFSIENKTEVLNKLLGFSK